MTCETLFAAIGDINDTFIEEAAAPPKRQNTVWIKWTALAACAAIVIFAAAFLPFRLSDVPPTVDTPDVPPTIVTTATDSSDAAPPAIVYPSEEDRYIAEIDGESFLTDQYAHGPCPGDCWIGMYLSPSSPHYDDPNALYWVSIIIHGEGGKQLMYGDEKRAEAQRLADLGYEIYIKELHWIGYWGEDKYYTAVCGLFTREHLETFQASPDYGYLLDYCPYDIEETQRLR